MAEINSNTKYTWLEFAKRTNDTMALEIAEVMNETNEIILDIPWFQCNKVDHEKLTRRTFLPSGTWRQANKGIAATMSGTQEVIEHVGRLEDRSEIDEIYTEGLNGPGVAALRQQEDVGHAEGLVQQIADELFEGTLAGTPEEFDGLQIRLNDTDQTNVIDGGGSSTLTSIYPIDWGRRGCYGIYSGSQGIAGLETKNKGKEPLSDDDGDPYYGWVTQFIWNCGIAVKDELRTGRYANINSTFGGSNTFDEDYLIRLLNLNHFRPATTRLYMNKEMKTQMQIRAKDKSNMQWTEAASALSGAPILMFNGAVVRTCEAIKNSETQVTT
jgi:hypothetical protein